MADWRAVEVVDGKNTLLGAGNEAQARAAFDGASRRGTTGKIILLNDLGMPVDEFAVTQMVGSMTGLPIREVTAKLPPSYAEAAERARNQPFILKCMVPKGQVPPPEDPPPAEQPEDPSADQVIQEPPAPVELDNLAPAPMPWWRSPAVALLAGVLGFAAALALVSVGC